MRKAVIVTSGSVQLSVDSEEVRAIHPLRSTYSEILADWQVSRKQDELQADYTLFTTLSELFGQKTVEDKEQQLVVLSDGKGLVGLVVDSAGEIEVAAESVHPLPPAFSVRCRKCFVNVVLYENDIFPVITPDSIRDMSMSAEGGGDSRETIFTNDRGYQEQAG